MRFRALRANSDVPRRNKVGPAQALALIPCGFAMIVAGLGETAAGPTLSFRTHAQEMMSPISKPKR